MKPGAKIRTLRKKYGWVQEQLASKLDINQSHMSALERGSKSITMDVLEQLSKIFNVPKTYFVDDEDIVPTTGNKDSLVLELMKNFIKEGIEIDEKVIDVISNTIDKYYKKL